MATSSKFIGISSSVLLEYIYADQSEINTLGNPYRLSTTTNPIWKMRNAHDGQDIILNSDANELIQIGLPLGTGNVRNRSYAYVDQYRSALLDIDKNIFYNDYDTNLTPTAGLPIVFNTSQSPVYDTVKLHLVQGFNYEQYQGLIFNLKAAKKDGKLFNLANFVFNRNDTYETLNPNSFFFGGRIYDSYLEFKVLSLHNLILDYWIGNLTGDTVVERITEAANGKQIGIKKDQSIQATFAWINERKEIDGQDYIYLYETTQFDIETQDQFSTVAATIQESTNGDYIEFYGTYNGAIIEQFINDLNSNGYNYMLLHDLVISEYIFDSSSQSYYWVKTDEMQISQTDNYDLVRTFRPIIKNSSAIAFKIDYVVRMYNRNDNSQVWKSSSLTSYSVAKYGRKLLQLNLGQNPTQSVIYNKNVIKDIQLNRIAEPVLDNAKYITSFLDNTQISISYSSMNPEVDTTSDNMSSLSKLNPAALVSNTNPDIYGNGLARILITNSVTFLKFVIYQNGNSGIKRNVALNLSGIGELILTFTSDTGENVEIKEYPSTYTSKSKGEIVFRLTEIQSNTILGFKNRQFRIFLINIKGEKTFLYNGRFYDNDQWLNMKEINRIAELESTLNKFTSQNTSLLYQIKIQSDNLTTALSNNQQLSQQINDYSRINAQLSANDASDAAQINKLTSANAAELATVSILNQQISNLNQQLDASRAMADSLNGQVKELNASLSLAQSKNLMEQGLLSTLQNQLASQSQIINTQQVIISAPNPYYGNPSSLSSLNSPVVVQAPTPVPTPSFVESQLSANQANINTTPATTYTQQGGGGGVSTQANNVNSSNRNFRYWRRTDGVIIGMPPSARIPSGWTPVDNPHQKTSPITIPPISVAPIQNTRNNNGTGGGGGGCFIEGTYITLPDGIKMLIEEVKVGMEILTYNEDYEENEIGIVKSLIQPSASKFILLDFTDGTGIQCTPEHPFWIIDKGWSSFDPTSSMELHDLEVAQLTEGDIALNEFEEQIVIEGITEISYKKPVKVYNLEIEDNHTYYANGILVHNKIASSLASE
jgi:hypothetical protein